jgi:hypothetical protein
MDERLVKRIRSALHSGSEDIGTCLIETLTELGGPPLTVRRARDSLSAVLLKARQGAPQLIGRTRDEIAVMLSLNDLIELAREVARPQSFGEALDAAGFEPTTGRRLVVGQGLKRQPLKRFRKDTP